jgi:type II secretory ATPase GspE/PulE/Tfp pilus assembly ATPase PilB-like protein
VFSTLHTNDAPGSFPRLIDLGVDEKVISSAINVAMAQRLVRKLCEKCKKERPATPEEQAVIDRHLSGVVDKALVPQKQNVVYEAAPQGCEVCHGRGYKGRVGIFEAIFMDETIEKLLRTGPSAREIADAARSQGIPTLTQDGVIKVLRGVTSLEELKRGVDLDATQ